MSNKESKKQPKNSVRLFTSECVTVGHPDKVSDYVSDSILTAILEQDKNARVAVETMCHVNGVVLAGEVTTTADVDYEAIARKAIEEIGYTHEDGKFVAATVPISVNIHQQSADIALGTNDEVGGSGDQGMMLGGAVAETPDLMPLPITMARALSCRLYEVICECFDESDEDPKLRADGKTQVTIAYNKDNTPAYVDTIVVSVSHSENVDVKEVRELVTEKVIKPVIKEFGYDFDTEVVKVYINPTGKFAIYGPNGDVGLTGRKIIVDTYGSYFGHGGGAFSGKDPSKTDRSGAYMARYIAKNIVASGVASKCEIQLAYAIGVAHPVSVNINMFGTSKYPTGLVSKAVYNIFDMTPKGIADTLQLRNGKIRYQDASVFGHFGEFAPETFPWESTDKADDIAAYCRENYIQ